MRLTAETCASCGALLTPATSFITEANSPCARCFGVYQDEEVGRLNDAESRHQKLLRQAKINAALHGMMWGAAVILTAHWGRFESDWITPLLILGAFALVGGLVLLVRVVYLVALALDASATAVLLVAGVIRWTSLWPLILLAGFPAILFCLAWTIRQAYARRDPHRI